MDAGDDRALLLGNLSLERRRPDTAAWLAGEELSPSLGVPLSPTRARSAGIHGRKRGDGQLQRSGDARGARSQQGDTEPILGADGARPQGGSRRRSDLLLARAGLHVGKPVRTGYRTVAALPLAA